MSDMNMQYIQHQVKAEVELIKGNWKDDTGKMYVQWLENFEQKVKNLCRIEETILKRGKIIHSICEEISGQSSDSHKKRTRKKDD